ncbi:CRTAC1 family protein [Pontibacter sp. G13]|uniref:CRTAC1 family protein n=1 Tax=Pontibacter sp. G13 TaxID=3074898 RepID=UPI00288B928C|nr:CRTAC1 family protein [Pontibacter sp. G13]WNJ19655.1 CRTAC1 family protein [Pontibacter sp. G13]
MNAKIFMIALFGGMFLVMGCDSPDKSDTLFRELSPWETGLEAELICQPSPEFNLLTYPYFYNGAGVAIGDLTGDELPEVMVLTNQGQHRLFRNLGDMQFEDITETAGVGGKGDWATGITMVDVNGDGWLDLYVSRVSGWAGLQGANELYLNQQDGTFVEAAEEMGLALRGFCTQGVFLDFDQDGDLDLFQLKHSIKPGSTMGPGTQRTGRDPLAGDQLLRNDEGQFVDVSLAAGIFGGKVGYGLSVTARDFDGDGWTDLYVCNDFHEEDYLYLNQRDGTFRHELRERMGHTSQFSMGSDMADMDGDGDLDLVTLDMKPDDEAILKTAEAPLPFEIDAFKRSFGYHAQSPRNAFQLNRGDGTFAEIAQMLQLDATDWSWAVLLADFDADGLRDMFVTNGIYRRPNDLDFLKYLSNPIAQQNLQGSSPDVQSFLDQMPSIPQSNRAFRQLPDGSFKPIESAWGLHQEGFSQGAAYGDLDLDGDLDLVVSHIGQPVSVLENLSRDRGNGHFLRIKLKGTAANAWGIGATVEIKQGNRIWVEEIQPVRGFLSSVDPVCQMALPSDANVKSLIVSWPGGRISLLEDIAVDQVVEIKESSAVNSMEVLAQEDQPFWKIRTLGGAVVEPPHDLQRAPLRPWGSTSIREAVAWEGADRFFHAPFGGVPAIWEGRNGDWQKAFEWPLAQGLPIVDAQWLDVEGDGDQDLWWVLGGNRSMPSMLWINDGQGSFAPSDQSLIAEKPISGACGLAWDANGDGAADMLVLPDGVAGQYGMPGNGHLWINDGKGRFTEQSSNLFPGLSEIGMIRAVDMVEMDGQEQADLVIVGEWMGVRVFGWDGKQWEERSEERGLGNLHGWWQSVKSMDVDGDGDQDLLVGNIGLNQDLRPDSLNPVEFFGVPMNQGGRLPVLSRYRKGQRYPVAHLDDLASQWPEIKRDFPTYQSFAGRTFKELFPQHALGGDSYGWVETASSMWFEQIQLGKFIGHSLPKTLQTAPILAWEQMDFDQNGSPEIWAAGNFGAVSPAIGPWDALRMTRMEWLPDGSWECSQVPPFAHLEGEIRVIHSLEYDAGQACWVFRSGMPPTAVLWE